MGPCSNMLSFAKHVLAGGLSSIFEDRHCIKRLSLLQAHLRIFITEFHPRFVGAGYLVYTITNIFYPEMPLRQASHLPLSTPNGSMIHLTPGLNTM